MQQVGHVLIVEDDAQLRKTLQGVLSYAGYEVHSWSDPTEFLDDVPALAPAVIITDMRLPGMSGVELHQVLIARGVAMPVIYVSGESTVQEGIRAMKLGPVDFLLKPFGREDLLRAVAAAIERDRYHMRETLERSRLQQAMSHLSPREREVYHLLIKGYSNGEIMDALRVSLPTAKQYKSRVMHKLGARSLSQLMNLQPDSEAPGEDATA